MSIYEFNVNNIKGESISLNQFKDNVLIVVNTASKCGFTPQYEDLQNLYERYKDKGLTILGFPCNQFMHQEPGSSEDIEGFCKLNYGVSFPLFEKVKVLGDEAHPIFKYLTKEAPYKGNEDNSSQAKLFNAMLNDKFLDLVEGDGIKWNFTKFLIDRNGNVVERYEPYVSPLDMEDKIKELL